MFHDVIQKVKAARFSLRHGVYGRLDAGHGSWCTARVNKLLYGELALTVDTGTITHCKPGFKYYTRTFSCTFAKRRQLFAISRHQKLQINYFLATYSLKIDIQKSIHP